ncbi:MAG: hypothetical protein WCG47_21825, partial [Dermatophilaceae bacterium]
TALRSHEELERRIKAKGNLLTPPVHATLGYKITTVHIMTDLPPGDPINLDGVVVGQDSFLLYRAGVTSAMRTGTFTNVVAKNPAANQPFEVEDSALSGTWTADLGRRVRLTSGPRENTVMWVAKDLGANRARVSDPSIIGAMVGDPFVGDDMTAQVPQPEDTYAVETLPQVTLGVIDVKSPGLTPSSPAGGLPGIAFAELDLREPEELSQLVHPSFDGITPWMWSCRVMPLCESFHWEAGIFLNCFLHRGLLANGPAGFTYFYGGLIGVSAATPAGKLLGVQCHGGSEVYLRDNVMLQDVGMRGQNLVIQAASVFDSVPTPINNPEGHGVFVGGSNIGYVAGTVSFMRNFSGGGFELWGSGNAGAGVAVGPAAQFAYKAGTFPTITGTAGDFTLGGETSSRAWDDTAGAYTTPRSNTWANLATPIGAGGFGDNAHSPARDAHIVDGL